MENIEEKLKRIEILSLLYKIDSGLYTEYSHLLELTVSPKQPKK